MAEKSECRDCRREGVKLFLKGERCLSPKCPIERKGALAPGGVKTRRTRRLSSYGTQLREKQKLKRLYDLEEKQFHRYFEKAKTSRAETIETFIRLLESRLDNVVYRLGFAPSRKAARQLVGHGHVLVNNHRVDIPSYLVKEGEIISLSVGALKMPSVIESLTKEVPVWLERKAAVGRIKRMPKREEIDTQSDEQAVVEFYSK